MTRFSIAFFQLAKFSDRLLSCGAGARQAPPIG
jgi:hypothetical protein